MQSRTGVLLVNLGTPEAPTPDAVGTYLREFLMDPYVIDIPWIARWILVNLLVIPKRKFDSAKLYQNIWSKEQGSPLLWHSLRLEEEVQALLESPVWLAMRYGEPSLPKAIEKIRASREKIDKLVVLPLYPQYSLAATESSVQRIHQLLKEQGLSDLPTEFVPAFYNKESYLDAVAEISRPHLEAFQPDKVFFSFHGVPERQVKKCDRSQQHCLKSNHCCEVMVTANQDCYRAQCFWTARWVAKRLGVKDYVVGFQSRLGRTPWIRPFSDELYEKLPAQGVKRLAVLSPSFVADCLETLEEIGIRAREQFKKAGGEELILVPSLNSEKVWAKAITDIIQK